MNRIIDGIEYKVNLKSLNSKGLQLNTYFPRYLPSLEVYTIQKIREKVKRGKIEFRVGIIFPKDALNIKLNRGVLESYLPVLKEISSVAGSTDPIPIDVLMNLENIIIVDPKDEILEKMKKHMDVIVEEAFKSLDEVKMQEGEKLKKIIQLHLSELKGIIDGIKNEVKNIKEEFEEKLKDTFEKVGKDLENLDKARLEEEILYLIERADITEEIDRLELHVNRFEEILENKDRENSGIILDFLCQEMHRELNTIASKSRKVSLIHLTVDGRDIVKKIKEQIQNIE